MVLDKLPPWSLKARYLEDSSNQYDNDVRLPLVKESKRSQTATANKKLTSSKQLFVSTRLIADKLPPNFSKVRHLKDSSDQNDNDVRLLSMRRNKKVKTKAAINKKPVNSKLLSVSTKLTLRIRQDVKAKKVFILNTS